MFSSYIDKFPNDRRTVLLELLKMVKHHLPNAKRSLKYGIPTFSIGDRAILSLAIQKHYFSVYIMDEQLMKRHSDDFKHLSTGKSCIRFKTLEQFPLESFKKILQDINKPS